MQPGQIAPAITRAEGALHVRVSLRDVATGDAEGAAQDLAAPDAPLAPAQIAAELAKVGGAAFAARSAAGRSVAARYVAGEDAAVMISGGQHANEPSGIVGALRAALDLAARESARITSYNVCYTKLLRFRAHFLGEDYSRIICKIIRSSAHREAAVNLRFPLHVQISTLFLSLILLVGVLLGGIGYLTTRDILENSATEISHRAAQQIAARMEVAIAPAETAVGIA